MNVPFVSDNSSARVEFQELRVFEDHLPKNIVQFNKAVKVVRWLIENHSLIKGI